MNINAVNNNTYTNPVENQAKLPTGAAADKAVKAFEKVLTNVGGAMTSTDVKKTMNGISEGISSVEDQLKADAQAAKANLKALFNKLSGAEAVKLSEDGFDINDIEDEELVTVVDRIKIMLAAYNENYQAFAGAFDVEGSKELEGSNGNLAAKVAAKLNEGYMPATEENVTDVMSTVEMAKDIGEKMPLSEEAKAYMIDNEMEPTIENVYKANHSTITRGRQAQVSDRQWEQLRGQVDKIVEASGLPKDEKTFADAKWLIANEIPVTGENLILKNQLDELQFTYNEQDVIEAAVDSMVGGKKASDVLLVNDYNVWKEAAKAIYAVNTVTESQVADIVNSGRKVTIEEMISAMEKGEAVPKAEFTPESASAIKTMYEARIMMTATATVSVINQGIDIYAEDLSNLVELLRQAETRYINEQLTKADAGRITEADFAQISAVNAALFELRFMPCAAIGEIVSVEGTVSITKVSSIAMNTQRQYDQAGQAYENMSTKARSDMGDSIKAAMKASGESILNDLGFAVTEDNLRAVRILAYNSMEMSVENVLGVREVDSVLNQLMDNMQPQVVYEMIKDGINPMETDIETLNQYVNENYNVQDEAVKYSEFLYKLEQDAEISEEERSQYIGIYKVFHTLKKDGGKAVGALMNQAAEVNLKNLVMAVSSRKRYDMDVSLGVDAGMATVTGTMYFENLFAKMAKNISPGALKKASENAGNLEEMPMEQLAEAIEEYQDYDKEATKEYYFQAVEEARQYQDVEDNVMRLLTDNGQPVTFYNLMAATELMKGNRFFQSLRDRKDDNVNKAMDGILEKLDSKEELDEAYAQLKDSVEAVKEQVLSDSGNNSYLDIKELKNIGKTVNLISSLSNRQQYFIPFMADGGVGSINLKVVKTEANMGKMEMSFATESLGSVYVEVQVTEVKVTGYMVSDNAAGVDLIKENVDKIAEALKKLGINSVDMKVAHSNSVPEVSLYDEGNGAPSSMIYRTAKEILTNLIEV